MYGVVTAQPVKNHRFKSDILTHRDLLGQMSFRQKYKTTGNCIKVKEIEGMMMGNEASLIFGVRVLKMILH